MLFSAVFALIQETHLHISKNKNKFAAALLLGLAFSATIGGMATPVGTPPNMYFFKAFKQAFPEDGQLNFIKWSAIGYPISFIFLVLTFFTLNTYFIRKKVELKIEPQFFKNNYKQLKTIIRVF